MFPNRIIFGLALPAFLTSPTSTLNSPTPTNTFVLTTPTVFASRIRPRPSLAPVLMDLMYEIDGYIDRLDAIDFMDWMGEIDSHRDRLASIRESLEAPRTPSRPRTSSLSSFKNSSLNSTGFFVMAFMVLVGLVLVAQLWVHRKFVAQVEKGAGVRRRGEWKEKVRKLVKMEKIEEMDEEEESEEKARKEIEIVGEREEENENEKDREDMA